MNFVKYFMRTKKFQWIWEKLLLVALYGMNCGPIVIQTNGEEALIENLIPRLPSGTVLFDVGANEGLYTLALLRHSGPDVRIFAFEPSSRAFEVLNDSVPSAPNVKLERIGFGESAGTADLFTERFGSAIASVYPTMFLEDGVVERRLTERIAIMRIDEYCRANGIGRINLLKIDVEAHELSVLKGCGDLLGNDCIDVIQFELGSNLDSRTFFKDFFDLLTPKFTLFRMVADGLVPLNDYKRIYELFACRTMNIIATRDVSLLTGMY